MHGGWPWPRRGSQGGTHSAQEPLVRAFPALRGIKQVAWSLARKGCDLAPIDPLERFGWMDRLPSDRIPTVVSARVCGPYSVFLVFDDGLSKQVNLRPFLVGPVFEPMLDPVEFAKLRVDHAAGTIVWPNEAYFAPETLYLLPDEREDAA